MKKKIALISIGIILLLTLITTFIVINQKKSNKQPKDTLTTELTAEIIQRLQNYPYHQQEPALNFKQIMEERPDLANTIAKSIFEEFDLFDKNQKFITSEELAYRTWNNHSAIRGILQTELKNGNFTEQDVEYQYHYGGWGEAKFNFEEMRTLSDAKAIKRGD